MATPRSVLRSTLKSRSKGANGFLQAPPSTVRRKVIFNENVYIQEILDIRDKTLHWDPAVDEEEKEEVAQHGSEGSSTTPTVSRLAVSSPHSAHVSILEAAAARRPKESLLCLTDQGRFDFCITSHVHATEHQGCTRGRAHRSSDRRARRACYAFFLEACWSCSHTRRATLSVFGYPSIGEEKGWSRRV